DSGRRSSGSEALRSPVIRQRYSLTFNQLRISLPVLQLLIPSCLTVVCPNTLIRDKIKDDVEGKSGAEAPAVIYGRN
ncbi:MAG: hypothetical protein ACFNYI_07620, partial [Eubacterium sp.]